MPKDVITRFKVDTAEYDRKIKRSKAETKDFGNAVKSLESHFGVSIAAIGKFTAAAGAIKGTLKVAKDAFFASETNVDDWGRTVESSKAVYEGFLNALNTGDFSGFFSNINSIVSAARDAYNALDELQTKSTIIAPAQAKAQAMINAQKEIIRKQGKDSDAGKAAQKEIERLEPILKASFQETADLNRNKFIADVKAKAEQAGITLTNEMWRSFTDTKALDSIRGKARGEAGGFQSDAYGHLTYAQDTRNDSQKFLDFFTDEFRRSVSPYLTAEWNARSQSYGVGIADARYMSQGSGKGRGSGGSGSSASIGGLSAKDIAGLSVGPTESLKELNAQLSMYKNLMQEAKSIADMMEAQSGIERVQKEIKAQPIALSLGVSTEEIVPIQEKIDNYFKEHPIQPLKIEETAGSGVEKTGKNVTQSWMAASRAIGAAGNALQQVEDPGAKIAGIVGQAIANIALGFATAAASPQTGAAGVFGWIAASAAGLATMLATITSIKNATEYHAEGGFVGGLARGTDTIPAMLTPGELVLNAAQQGNIASAMSSQGQQMDIRHSVRAEDIVIAINNYGRRTGRGEILKG